MDFFSWEVSVMDTRSRPPLNEVKSFDMPGRNWGSKANAFGECNFFRMLVIRPVTSSASLNLRFTIFYPPLRFNFASSFFFSKNVPVIIRVIALKFYKACCRGLTIAVSISSSSLFLAGDGGSIVRPHLRLDCFCLGSVVSADWKNESYSL